MDPILNLFSNFSVLPTVLLLVLLIFFIIVGLLVNRSSDNSATPKEKPFAEKYRARNVLDEYEPGDLHNELLNLGRQALQDGDFEKAREYLEDSRALVDRSDVRMALAEYHCAVGNREKAKKLLEHMLGGLRAPRCLLSGDSAAFDRRA